MSIVDGFFSRDPDRVRQALDVVAGGASSGTVTNVHSMYPTEDGIAYARAGLLDAKTFGKTEAEHRARFGHVTVHGLIHPIAFHLARRPFLERELRSVAAGRLAIRNGELVAPETNNPRSDLIGPRGFIAYLRATDSSHPALAFCAIDTVPVLPRAARPLVRDLGPTMVAPWIGPVNERYVELVDRADRHARCRATEAPQRITDHAQWMAQAALLALFDELVPPRLSPALVPVPERLRDERVLGLAWAGDALVVQRCDHVSVVDRDGVVRLRTEASACRLRGVIDARHAVFQGFFDSTSDYDFLEASVADLETGTYLARPLSTMPAAFIEESDHDALSLASLGDGPIRKTLRYGDRAPRLLAYTPDLNFAWVGEPGIGTAIVELATGIPHALPLEPGEGGDGVAAVVFADAAWHLLWPDGIIADVRGTNRVPLPVSVRIAAFSADGKNLAVVTRENDAEVLLVDRANGTVRSRIPIPY